MQALRRDSRDRLNVLASARAQCVARLGAEPFRSIAAALDRRMLDAAACAAMLRDVDEASITHYALRRLAGDIVFSSSDIDRRMVARTLLLRAALAAIDELPRLPLPPGVIARFGDEFTFIAMAGAEGDRFFEVGSSRFTRACKLVTLRRFPAGQFEWERSGISRRDLLRVQPRSIVTALAVVAFRMGGLGPVFFSHLNPRRPVRSLDEREANRSYYLMALAMEQQPDVRGFGACSWFRSPATQAVSPRLAWVSRVFLENGGTVVESGRADLDCGVFHRSETRRRLYAEGRFTPTLGLVLWPRRAMIAWAHAHPEFAT